MGPRSVERGRVQRRILSGPQLKASMGPRSVERGRRPIGGLGGLGGFASMGPRSVERGRLSHALTAVLAATLQWGRALLSAEGSLSAWIYSPGVDRFNGAALC